MPIRLKKLIGTVLILIWIYRIATGGVPDLYDSLLQTKLHVAIQFLTAAALIVWTEGKNRIASAEGRQQSTYNISEQVQSLLCYCL